MPLRVDAKQNKEWKNAINNIRTQLHGYCTGQCLHVHFSMTSSFRLEQSSDPVVFRHQQSQLSLSCQVRPDSRRINRGETGNTSAASSGCFNWKIHHLFSGLLLRDSTVAFYINVLYHLLIHSIHFICMVSCHNTIISLRCSKNPTNTILQATHQFSFKWYFVKSKHPEPYKTNSIN